MSAIKKKKPEYKVGQVYAAYKRDVFTNDIARSFEFVLLEIAPTFKAKTYSRSVKVRCIKNTLAHTLPVCGAATLNSVVRLSRLNKMPSYDLYAFRNHTYQAAVRAIPDNFIFFMSFNELKHFECVRQHECIFEELALILNCTE